MFRAGSSEEQPQEAALQAPMNNPRDTASAHISPKCPVRSATLRVPSPSSKMRTVCPSFVRGQGVHEGVVSFAGLVCKYDEQ